MLETWMFIYRLAHLAEIPAFDDGQRFLHKLAAHDLLDQAGRRGTGFQFIGTRFQLGAVAGNLRQRNHEQWIGGNASRFDLLHAAFQTATGSDGELDSGSLLSRKYRLLSPKHERCAEDDAQQDDASE